MEVPTRARLRCWGGHPQALLTPQTLDLLAVEAVALPHQHGMGSAIAPAGMGLGEGPQPRPQLSVGIGLRRGVALRGAVLADDATGPPLRNAEPGLEHVHGSASPRRAYQFSRLISRSASIL